MTLAMDLAQRIKAVTFRDLPDEAVESAKTAILDTIGVTLLGAGEKSTRSVANVPGIGEAPGASLVFGSDRRTSALDATLINGVAAHAVDFDDFTEVFGGHPSVPIVPALVALGEAQNATGPDLLAAYVVGVEAETRIAHGVHFHHYEKGWHPTATLGVFGAAAACAHLLDLSEEKTATALCIAVSLAAGVKANFGSMTKPLHVGHAGRNGLFAALLAKRGFSANLGAFDDKQGFLEVYNGEGRFDAALMLEDWYAPPVVVEPGIALKQFPCCGSIHPAIMMMLELRDRHQLCHEEIGAIEVLVHPRRLPHTDNPDPQSGLEAKFSAQYCVARALLEGRIALAHFEGEAHRDLQVRELMEHVRIAPHPDMQAGAKQTFGAEVIVHRADGENVSERTEQWLGRGPDNPMSEEELREKFQDCAGRSLNKAKVPVVWDLLRGFETLDNIRDFTHELVVPSVQRRTNRYPGMLRRKRR